MKIKFEWKKYIMKSNVPNTWIRHAIRLAHDAKYRKAHDTVIIGGFKMIDEYFEHGNLMHIKIRIAATPLMRSKLVERKWTNVSRVECISEANLMRITREPSPQGIVAEVSAPILHNEDIINNGASRILILYEPQDPGNFGSLLRTAALLGWRDVIIIGTETLDHRSYNILRTSMGVLLYPQILRLYRSHSYTTIKRLLRDYRRVAGSPIGHSRLEIRGEKIALILGNESHGIPQHILEDFEPIRIPMMSKGIGPDSLNLAVAGGILMNQLRL